MDYVFVPVCQIKGVWYFVTSISCCGKFSFLQSLSFGVCVHVWGDSSVCKSRFGVCYCRFMESEMFIYIVIFALYQTEDVYLVPLVGSGLRKLVFLMVAHTKHSAADGKKMKKGFSHWVSGCIETELGGKFTEPI